MSAVFALPRHDRPLGARCIRRALVPPLRP